MPTLFKNVELVVRGIDEPLGDDPPAYDVLEEVIAS
jgi:hypothetical protein